MRVSHAELNADIIEVTRRSLAALNLDCEVDSEPGGVRMTFPDHRVMVVRPDTTTLIVKIIMTAFQSVSADNIDEASLFIAMANHAIHLGHLAIELGSRELRMYMDVPFAFCHSPTDLENLIGRSLTHVDRVFVEHLHAIDLLSTQRSSAIEAIARAPRKMSNAAEMPLPSSRFQRKSLSADEAFALLTDIVSHHVSDGSRSIENVDNDNIILVQKNNALLRTTMRVDSDSASILLFSSFNQIQRRLRIDVLHQAIAKFNSSSKFGRISFDQHLGEFVLVGVIGLSFNSIEVYHRDMSTMVVEHLRTLETLCVA